MARTGLEIVRIFGLATGFPNLRNVMTQEQDDITTMFETTNGVLDTKHYREENRRSWIFRTVGYGHPRHFWCNFVSALRMAGYDGALSV